jgi:hypothetical protein
MCSKALNFEKKVNLNIFELHFKIVKIIPVPKSDDFTYFLQNAAF